MFHKLAWQFNRLSVMDLAEIRYRLKQNLQLGYEKLGRGLVLQPPPPAEAKFGLPWVVSLPIDLERDSCIRVADRVLQGRMDVLSLEDVHVGFPPRWNQDPKTGTRVPLVYGKSLDYRDPQKVGDIKYLWEPNRHLQVTALAQAYHLSGDLRYAEGAQRLLESWFEQCPYPLGPNWVSSLELAIRLVNWSCCWHLLGGEKSPLFASEEGRRFKRRWLDSIYQHCHFISGYLSRWSSANNHLFGELTGLYIASITWPCWKASQAWLDLARAELEAEAVKQNYSDGVNREQAIYYHHEVIDMMLLCWLTGRANDLPPTKRFVALIERMLEFLASMMNISGALPMIGDADDALLVRWEHAPDWNPYRSLLASGAVLFERPDFAAKAGVFDGKSRWLLGDDAAAVFDRLATLPDAEKSAYQNRRQFPEGGYFILGDHLDTPDETRLIVDAGPLGYLGIAAHGHADALSFCLSVKGNELLVDPGTYAYHTDKQWRDYFRGTSAHNTVRVDGLDQSEPGGNFMWLRKANAICERWERGESEDCFVGFHDGYRRLGDPVVHKRKIVFDKRGRTILVEDTLDCAGTHDIEIFWHFAETCQVSVNGEEVVALCPGTRLEMSMRDVVCVAELRIGCEAGPCGWISRRLDRKVPAPSVVWRARIRGATTFTTLIRIRDARGASDETGLQASPACIN